MAEEGTELEEWLKQLLKAAAQINEFFQKHLVYEDGEESLDILSDQETQTLRAIMQPGKGGRIKLVFDIPEGQVLPYIIKDPDWNAYIAFNVNEQGQVIQRVYFDDGNVPFQEIKNIIFSFESRFKQRRPGRPTSARPIYREFKARHQAGENRERLEKWLLEELTDLIYSEQPDDNKDDLDARLKASSREYRFLRRYDRKMD